MLASPAAPGAKLLIVKRVTTAAFRATGSQLPRRFFVELLPVIVTPSRPAGHVKPLPS